MENDFESEIIKHLLKNPGFYQSPADKCSFIGNLKIEGNFFHVQFQLPNFPKIDCAKGCITKGLDIYSLPQINNDDLNIDDFMNLICSHLKNIVDLKYSQYVQEEIPLANFNSLPEQLSNIKSYKCKTLINKLYTHIKFEDFEKYPGHYLELNIESLKSSSSTSNIQIINHSLPDCIFNNNSNSNGNNINDMFRHSNTIENILIKFLQFLDQLDEFYDNLNTIDELCYVVEPNQITLKHNWRIFKLNEKIFIKISIDPLQSSSVEVNLIGPTHEIEKYREMYNEKVKNWDIDLDIYKNLLRIFNLMYFPIKNKINDNDNNENELINNKYCNICFMYMLDNHIPLISCDNPKCHLIFHAYCLKEWFSTLMDEKTFLNVNLGNCPFCKEKLSTSFVQLLEL